MDKVGFAIAGCGSIAVKHLEAIRIIESAEIKYVYDLDKNKGEGFAHRYGVGWIDRFNDLLKKDEIHVVNICAPSAFHGELALAAARAGKHVLVEKPMALTLDDADRMIEVCENAGVKLSVALQNRYKPAAAALKEAVSAGFFGKLTHGAAVVRWNRNRDYYRDSPWRGSTILGGGVLINQAIHNVDLLQWLMGDAESVFAYTAARLLDMEAEDVAVGVIRFKNGALGTVEAASTIFPGNLEESINIFGEKGTVIIGGERADKVLTWNFSENCPGVPLGISEEKKGHLPLIEDMVKCVRQNTKPCIDGEEGRRSLQVVLAFHESARIKKVIKLT